MSEFLTIDLKELETKVENGKGFNHKEAVVLLEFVRKIIGNDGVVPQPQLTILKSVADMADKTDLDKIYCFGAQEFYWMFGHDHDKYVPIIFAYLAGKALGVDLVKVVEND